MTYTQVPLVALLARHHRTYVKNNYFNPCTITENVDNCWHNRFDKLTYQYMNTPFGDPNNVGVKCRRLSKLGIYLKEQS